jgi:DNA-binding transcriptional regulator YdaS (Cro superfamily)
MKALPAETRIVGRQKTSAMKRLAASISTMPASASSFGSLQRSEDALATPARLRRIGGDMLDAELRQRPSHLRQGAGSTFSPAVGVKK